MSAFRKGRRTRDEMVGWHHRLNGHELVQTPGDGEGQGSLACCSPWGHRESDMIERLNNNGVGLGGLTHQITKHLFRVRMHLASTGAF